MLEAGLPREPAAAGTAINRLTGPKPDGDTTGPERRSRGRLCLYA